MLVKTSSRLERILVFFFGNSWLVMGCRICNVGLRGEGLVFPYLYIHLIGIFFSTQFGGGRFVEVFVLPFFFWAFVYPSYKTSIFSLLTVVIFLVTEINTMFF